MRTEKEIYDLVLNFAFQDERIRIVTLEGSRTNVNIPKDNLQDYDITFFVIDMGEFLKSDDWLSVFGNRIMMQKPEDMELFPPEEKGFSYIPCRTCFYRLGKAVYRRAFQGEEQGSLRRRKCRSFAFLLTEEKLLCGITPSLPKKSTSALAREKLSFHSVFHGLLDYRFFSVKRSSLRSERGRSKPLLERSGKL